MFEVGEFCTRGEGVTTSLTWAGRTSPWRRPLCVTTQSHQFVLDITRTLPGSEVHHLRFSKRPARRGVDQDGDCLPPTRESPLLRSEGPERTDEGISTCIASLHSKVLFVPKIPQVSVSIIGEVYERKLRFPSVIQKLSEIQYSCY